MTEIINMMQTIDTDKLCEAFELTNENNDENMPFARGLIMDELEKRNPVNFANWMDTEDFNEMDHPSLFFGV